MNMNAAVAAVEDAFDKFDTDGSATVDKYELQRLCASLGARLNPVQAEAAMRLLDRNGDGTIDKREFVDWWLSRGDDLDGDGKVSEVEAGLRKVALSGTNDAVRRYIDKMHDDRDALNREMLMLEEDKARIQKRMVQLQDALSRSNEELTYKRKALKDVEVILAETETAYRRILESSQSLLSVVHRHMPAGLDRAHGRDRDRDRRDRR